MEFFIIIGILSIQLLFLLIINILNDCVYIKKYKQMAKFNYFICKCYYKLTDYEYSLILDNFYKYLDKEHKQKQKEYEKQLKEDFKKNIKDDIKWSIF